MKWWERAAVNFALAMATIAIVVGFLWLVGMIDERSHVRAIEHSRSAS